MVRDTPESEIKLAHERLEREMFFWFLVAVGVVIALTLLGALVSRRAPGTDWQEHEDRPIGPGADL